MEMRARKASTGGSRLLNGNGSRVNGSSRPRGSARQKRGVQSVIPLSTAMCLVLAFVGAGYLQHHYKVSRAQDPMQSGHVGLPKFVRDMRDRQQKKHGGLQQQVKKPGHVKNTGGRIGDTNGVTPNKNSLLTPEEDASLERDKDGIRYHLIFSTDCSPYQHWQSYLVYFTAMLVRQPGHVTRIASGCQDDEAEGMKQWFQDHIAHMSPNRFHLQLTPHFSSIKDASGEVKDYKYLNKPFGLKFWLENSPELKFQTDGTFPERVQEDIVILIDPDMGLLKPITRDFTSDVDNLITDRRKEKLVSRIVGPGHPAAQVYGFGTQWARLNLTKITGDPNTPAAKVSKEDGQLFYPVGPPYMGTVQDMYHISLKWTEFGPKVHEQYPYLLAEMFAFCIAAAHLELPHQLISSLMVSDVTAGGDEGWPLLVDKIPNSDICVQGRSLATYPANTTGMPSVVHMCQRYGLGADWFFSKRAIPADSVYECDAPLFTEPPDNVAELYDYKMLPPKFERKALEAKQSKRMGFVLCYLFRLINEAATFFKSNACGNGSSSSKPNLEKTRNLAQYMVQKNKKKK